MNSITLHGRLAKDATVTLVNSCGVETPLVTFSFIDGGLPYQKSEPMFIDVHFMKEAAMRIFDFLKKGKEVVVSGCLRSKNYVTQAGEKKQKYYVSADYVMFTGKGSDDGTSRSARN